MSDCPCDLPGPLHSDAAGLHLADGRPLPWHLDDTAYADPAPRCCCCGGSTEVARYLCMDHGSVVCVHCFEGAVTLARCDGQHRRAA